MKEHKVKIKGVTPYIQHRMYDHKLKAWEFLLLLIYSFFILFILESYL